MIPILIAFAAGAAAPAAVPANLKACTDQTVAAPDKAVAAAEAWVLKGGGADARLCQGLALVALERWAAAAGAFEQAAAAAVQARDPRQGDLWVQAGNAWLAADEAGKAKSAFDAALATGTLAGQLQGEVYLDRARAGVALREEAGARADLDKALTLVPGDGFAWYLSAALARRQGDLKRARSDIAKAVSLAPDESSILLEAGNIAAQSDEIEGAKALYARAARAQPASDAARAARAALAANPDVPVAAAPAAAPPR